MNKTIFRMCAMMLPVAALAGCNSAGGDSEKIIEKPELKVVDGHLTPESQTSVSDAPFHFGARASLPLAPGHRYPANFDGLRIVYISDSAHRHNPQNTPAMATPPTPPTSPNTPTPPNTPDLRPAQPDPDS